MKKIPLVNLKRAHAKVEDRLFLKLRETFNNGDFILGKPVTEFEKEFSKKVGTKHTAGCSSGTSALELSLRALGIKDGDEVITSDLTFFATIEAIHAVGATPVLADICPKTYCSNIDNIKPLVTKKTRAIISVHLYGNIAYIDEISKFCKKNNLKYIQDAAQAHLGQYNNKPLEKFSDAVCYSFYPGKNLGAMGDAGCVTSEKQKIIQKIKFLRDHGRSSKYLHEEMALSARMDSFQAIPLKIKLGSLRKTTKRRQFVAKKYDEALEAKGFKIIKVHKKGICVYHLYTVLVEDRDQLLKKLHEAGIGAGVHYPVPMHQQPGYFKNYKSKKKFYYSSKVADHTISLPICGEITNDEIEFIIHSFIALAKPYHIKNLECECING